MQAAAPPTDRALNYAFLLGGITAVVFGLMAGLIALPAVVLLLVALFRVLVIICQGEVWAAWLAMGGIFVGLGALVWARRNS